MEMFFNRWKDNPVILDTWFAFKASTPWDDGIKRIEELIRHPLFDPLSPNSIRAVLGGLASNPIVFHAKDGSGYEFMVNQILQLDKSNPITASRVAKVFSQWRNYSSPYQEGMHDAIKKLSTENLSPNTSEVIELIISAEDLSIS